jgi:hypothetical protein
VIFDMWDVLSILYMKPIIENGERILRVVINSETRPQRVVTVFFDRRARRQI